MRAAYEAHVQCAGELEVVGKTQAACETFGCIGALDAAPDKAEIRRRGIGLWSLDHHGHLTRGGTRRIIGPTPALPSVDLETRATCLQVAERLAVLVDEVAAAMTDAVLNEVD